jgi:hypothetical protein
MIGTMNDAPVDVAIRMRESLLSTMVSGGEPYGELIKVRRP